SSYVRAYRNFPTSRVIPSHSVMRAAARSWAVSEEGRVILAWLPREAAHDMSLKHFPVGAAWHSNSHGRSHANLLDGRVDHTLEFGVRSKEDLAHGPSSTNPRTSGARWVFG